MKKVIKDKKITDSEFEQGKIYLSDNGRIVICTDPQSPSSTNFSGVCVHDPNKVHDDGHYSISWARDGFTEFTGSITISN